MTVLAMDTKINVASHHALLPEISTFAQTQSWTEVEINASKEWGSDGGGGFQFNAGSESYLALQSTGYGSQVLHYRLRTRATGADPDAENIELGAFKSGNVDKDTTSSVHPVQRANGGVTNWNVNHRFFSCKPTSIPKVWLFGNNKFILVVVQMDSNYVQFLAFGSVELKDTSDTEGNYCGNITNTANDKWYDKDLISPFDSQGNSILYEGAVISSANEFINIQFNSSDTPSSKGLEYGKLIQQNGFSAVRPIMKPSVRIKRTSDSRVFRLGTLPIFRTDVTDKEIGEEVTYGAEKYLVFPNGLKGTRQKGIAVRIL